MLRTFIKDTSGNFSIMMGVSATMLLGAVGVAVDFSGMINQRSTMQDYADAAVLAAARTLENDLSIMTKAANESVSVNTTLDNNISTTLRVFPDYIRVDLKANYSTSVMGLFGHENLEIDVFAEAPNATPDPLNLALVLDTTGSMIGGNMSSLKSSAARLVNTLEKHDDGNIKISVIPFANYVNIGTGDRGKPWLEVENDWVETYPERCSTSTRTTGGPGPTRRVVGTTNCRNETTTTPRSCSGGHTTYNDGVAHTSPETCSGPTTRTRQVCDNVYEDIPEDEQTNTPIKTTTTESCYTPPPTYHKWHGEVGTRLPPAHTEADYKNVKSPGLMDYPPTTAQLLRLTNSFNSVKSKISSLSANGETYIPAGLVWGWRTLTTSPPFTEAATNQGTGVKTALVLMTDGKNTRTLGTGSVEAAPGGSYYNVVDHSTLAVDGLAANALSAELCEGIKDDDIIVYTVAYNLPSGKIQATKKMLEDCATSKEHHYEAKNTAQLNDAFDAIAISLISIRLSG